MYHTFVTINVPSEGPLDLNDIERQIRHELLRKSAGIYAEAAWERLKAFNPELFKGYIFTTLDSVIEDAKRIRKLEQHFLKGVPIDKPHLDWIAAMKLIPS